MTIKTIYADHAEWIEANRERLENLIESAKTEFGAMFDVSLKSFGVVKKQMEDLGWDGYPYVHCRTFDGWRRSGRQVRKGEKCQLKSITIVSGGDDNPKTYPKTTNLFHINQTDPIDGFSDEPASQPAPQNSTAKRSRKPKGKTAGIAVVQSGVTVTENKDKDGIEIRFDVRPDDAILTQVKSAGFRWGRAAGCWYSKDCPKARVFAYSLKV